MSRPFVIFSCFMVFRRRDSAAERSPVLSVRRGPAAAEGGRQAGLRVRVSLPLKASSPSAPVMPPARYRRNPPPGPCPAACSGEGGAAGPPKQGRANPLRRKGYREKTGIQPIESDRPQVSSFSFLPLAGKPFNCSLYGIRGIPGVINGGQRRAFPGDREGGIAVFCRRRKGPGPFGASGRGGQEKYAAISGRPIPPRCRS